MRKLIDLAGAVLVVALVLPAAPLAAEKAPAKAAAKASTPATAEAAAPAVKVGDTVYVCGCGASCPCGVIQAAPGKCGCGSPLVKATVTRLEGDQIFVKREGQPEQPFKAPYKCGCAGCNCGVVGVAPGKCGCGKPLVPNK